MTGEQIFASIFVCAICGFCAFVIYLEHKERMKP